MKPKKRTKKKYKFCRETPYQRRCDPTFIFVSVDNLIYIPFDRNDQPVVFFLCLYCSKRKTHNLFYFRVNWKTAKIRTVIFATKTRPQDERDKTALAEKISDKTSRILPSCNDCAVTIVTGRIDQIMKTEGEGSSPSWSWRRRLFKNVEQIERVRRYTPELCFQ